VQDLGGQVLAGARFSGQQHRRGRTRGDPLEQRLEFAQLRRIADDAIEAVGLGLRRPQLSNFAPQPRGLERLLDERRQRVEIERLVHEVVRAQLHRFDRGLDARIRGQQDHQQIGIDLPDLLQHR